MRLWTVIWWIFLWCDSDQESTNITEKKSLMLNHYSCFHSVSQRRKTFAVKLGVSAVVMSRGNIRDVSKALTRAEWIGQLSLAVRSYVYNTHNTHSHMWSWELWLIDFICNVFWPEGKELFHKVNKWNSCDSTSLWKMWCSPIFWIWLMVSLRTLTM